MYRVLPFVDDVAIVEVAPSPKLQSYVHESTNPVPSLTSVEVSVRVTCKVLVATENPATGA